MGRITKDDRCLIIGLQTENKWGAKRLISEFPNKRWSQSSLTHLLGKIDNYWTTERKSGIALTITVMFLLLASVATD